MKLEADTYANPELLEIEEALKLKFGDKAFAAAMARAQFRADMSRLLRKRRMDLNLDQKSLAKILNTTQQQLSKYEVGENSPTLERLYDLCMALNLELIVRDKDEKNVLIQV